MKAQQLRKYIIEPTLKHFSKLGKNYKSIYSESAVKLLLMTAAVETNMGKYIIQNNSKMVEDKKALGIYQTERATIDYVLSRRDSYLNRAIFCLSIDDIFDRYTGVINDLSYATIMARAVYWYKSKTPLPQVDNNEGLWKYYKKYYNSSLGDTTKEEFFRACKKNRLL